MKTTYKGFRIAVVRGTGGKILYEVSEKMRNGHVINHFSSFVSKDGDVRQMVKNCKEMVDGVIITRTNPSDERAWFF